MTQIEQLLKAVDLYCESARLSPATISTRIFNDGQKIGRLRAGGDVTTGWHRKAMVWLSVNWPDDAAWPEGVDRPAVDGEAA